MVRTAMLSRTSLALIVLAAFCAVVAGSPLFPCPYMAASSCCPNSGDAGNHCPADASEYCLLAVSEGKIGTAKPKLGNETPLAAISTAHPLLEASPEAAAPALPPVHTGRGLHLLNRVLLI